MAEEKSIAEEIGEIVANELQKAITPVVFPDSMQVEVTNPQEPVKIDLSGLEKAFREFATKKAPVMTPPDFSSLERLLVEIRNTIATPTTDNSPLLREMITAIQANQPIPTDFTTLSDEIRGMVEEVKKIKERPADSYRGGAIGPSKIFHMNSKGVVVDVAVAVADEEVLSKTDPQGTLIAAQVLTSVKGKAVAHYIESVDHSLRTIDLVDRETQQEILTQLRLISLKLDCLQPDDEINEDELVLTEQ